MLMGLECYSFSCWDRVFVVFWACLVSLLAF